MFGPYRVNIIRFMGGHATKEEEDSFALMWRWVSRIEGANNQILGRTADEQFRLQSRVHQYWYQPTDKAQELTRALIDGVAVTPEYLLPKRMHAALVRRLLSEGMLGTLPGRDFPKDLGLKPDRAADLAVSGMTGTLRALNQTTRVRPVKRQFERHGFTLVNHVVERGLDGIKAEYRGGPVAGVATDK